MKNGVVIFLDILGWKGIYARHNTLAKDLANFVKEIRGEFEKKLRGLSIGDPNVVSISDTIAVFIEYTDELILPKIINSTGTVLTDYIKISIKRGIPLRGAISKGMFDVEDNIFVVHPIKSR